MKKNAEEHKAEGQVDKMKGEMKDKYGKLTGDKTKQAAGKMDKAKGEVKKQFGKMKEKVEDDRSK